MNRRILEYPKVNHGHRSKILKLGVSKLSEHKREHRSLLVIGTGRCGTTSVANLFQKMRLDLQHERVGDYGTASLFFTVDSDWYPMQPFTPGKVHVGERRSDFIFERVLHIVRTPEKTITSMQGIFPSLNYEFFEENSIIPYKIKSQLLRCAFAYYNLNKLCEQQTDVRFQLEKIVNDEKQFIRFSYMSGLGSCQTRMPVPVKNKSSGYRKREPLKWETLHDLDPLLTKNIQKMARRYGY